MNTFPLFALDTEDDSEGHLVGGCLYDCQTGKIFSFQKPAKLWKELQRRKYAGGVVVAHNAEYDICNLVHKQISHFNRYIQYEGRFIVAEWQRGEKDILRFLSTTNHYPSNLKSLGDILGLPKLEDPGLHLSWKERQDYCARDAQICGMYAQYLQKYYNDLGTSLRATVGGSALELFQRKFQGDLTWQALPLPFISYFRQAYFGGRCECFKLGTFEGPIFHYDVNSLYPHSARILDFPHPAYLIFKNNPKPNCIDFEGASNVTISCKDDFPVLPYRKGKLIFPIGKFSGIYPNNLLRWAIQNTKTKILKIHSTLSSTKSAPYLRGFVDYVYAKRLEAKNPIEKEIAKRILNNLYGKFAQTGSGFNYDSETKKFVAEKTVFPASTNVIWSAMITVQGYATLRPFFDSHSLYTDTDSLFTTKPLPPSEIGKELGKMKQEGEYEKVRILLPKFYYCVKSGKVEYKAKGFPNKVIYDGKEISPAQQAFETGKATFRRPLRLRESLASQLKIPNVWIETTKTIRATYDKRRVMKDGSTKPLIVKE